MTEDDLARRDELASALLDGEHTDDPLAADPVVRQRVEQLRTAAEAVRAQVPPAPAGARDAAVVAALHALDTHALDTRDPERTSDPTASPARWWHRGAGTPERRLRLLGAAAAVLLVLAAIPVVASLSRPSDDDTASADAEAGDEAEALTEAFAGDGADDLATATADAASPGDELRQSAGAVGGASGAGLVDLGVHDDAERLAARAAAAAGLEADRGEAGGAEAPVPAAGAGPPGVTTTAPTEPRPCEAEIEALDGDLLLVGLARLGADAVVVAVLDGLEGATVVVFDPEPPTCSVITEIDVQR
jgi:hypothetical protein